MVSAGIIGEIKMAITKTEECVLHFADINFVIQ